MEQKVYDFISQSIWEKIIENKVCSLCWESFPIYEWERKILDRVSPSIGSEKMLLPLPDECPTCRQIRRLIFRNENNFYKVKSKASWKPIVSVYCEDVGLNIYSFDEYYNSNEFQNNIEVDTNNFTSAMDKLYRALPQIALQNWPNMENSEYNNLSWWLKNCYLCYDCWGNENSYYCAFLGPWTHDVIDCFDWVRLDNSYSLIGSSWVTASQYCSDASDLYNCYFCDNCYNLKNCIWCRNIWNQEHMIFNKEVSHQEFEDFKKKYFNWKYSDLLEFIKLYDQFSNNLDRFPHTLNVGCENVIWEYMLHANNIFFGRFTYRSSDCRYTYFCDSMNDCMDMDFCVNDLQLSYQCISSINSYGIIWCVNTAWSKNCYYCHTCTWCSDCIGCYWLTNQQYCIFNKKYSKEEYEIMAKKILNDLNTKWVLWKAFDSVLSFFPYNDTVAFNVYPPKYLIDFQWIQKVINENWKWTIKLLEDKFISKAILDLWWDKKLDILYRTKDNEVNVPAWLQVIDAKDLPDSIHDVDETILNKWVKCEISWRVFRIIKPELEFYKKHNIPFPRKHSWVRQIEKFQKRPSGELFLRTCTTCSKEILSIYSQDSRAKVMCMDCYNK